MQMSKDSTGCRIQSISFPTLAMLTRAKRRAKARRRSLSAHICDLIHEDLAKAPAESPAVPAEQTEQQ